MITEKVTKLDVARRQIDEAIRMFFDRRDPIAVHTVVSAAAQVLSDLGKTRGFQGWTRNPSVVKPGRWKEWREAITRFEAFFKHADKDADATCDFRPDVTQLFILEAVELLRVFIGKFTWEGMIFSIWFSVKYPDLLKEGEFKDAIAALPAQPKLDAQDLSLVADLLKIRHTLPQSIQDLLLA
jgi:hypothetical protein